MQRFTRNSWPACGLVAIPSVGAFAFVCGAGQLVPLAVCERAEWCARDANVCWCLLTDFDSC